MSTDVYMVGSSSHGEKWCKHKFHGRNQQKSQTDAQVKKKQNFNQRKKKGFFKKKKHVSKLKCYNRGKKGHFVRDCKESRKANDLFVVVSTIYVSSSVFFTESYSLWTGDSGATDHVAKGRSALVEFLRILQGTK